MSWYISDRFFHVRCLYSTTSSGTASAYSSQTRFPFMLIPSPSTSSSGCISSLLNGSSIHILTVSYSFYKYIYVWFKFYFQHFSLYFFADIPFFGQFSLSIMHLCKISSVFIIGRQGGNLTVGFAVCTNWITDHRATDCYSGLITNKLWKKSCDLAMDHK